MAVGIERYLPNDEYQATVNSPTQATAANPFVTVADVVPDGNGIYDGSDTLTVDTVVSMAGFDLAFSGTGQYTIGHAIPSGNARLTVVGASTAFSTINTLWRRSTGSLLGEIRDSGHWGLGGSANSLYTVNISGGQAGTTGALRVEDSGNVMALQVDNDNRVGIGAMGLATEKFNVRGIGATSGTWGIIHENASGAYLNKFRDDGFVELAMNGQSTRMGASGTNYFIQTVNFTTQFSSTGTYTGFHANRNGSGITMRGSSVTRQNICATGTMEFMVDWNNNINSVGTYAMHIHETTQNLGIGLASSLVIPASKLTVGGDMESVGSANGLILESPDTTRWRVTVSNAGALVIATV